MSVSVRRLVRALALSSALGLGACTVTVVTPPTPEDTARLETALDLGDLAAVRNIAVNGPSTNSDIRLANAALDYWLDQGNTQAADLARASTDQSLSPVLRRDAAILLSGLHFREGRYADTVAALDLALPAITDADLRASLEQTRAFAAALAGTPAMQAAIGQPATIALHRDKATLTRAEVAIDGGPIDAILDTGSAVSAISESNARRLGLRILPTKVSVGTATSASAGGMLGVAPSVKLGNATFTNVVFLVMPDSALTFSGGAYKVEAIIGLPLLRRLGRLEYRQDGTTETLHYAHTTTQPDARSNLMLDAEQAFLIAPADGADARPLRLFIDNGAVTSHLNHRFKAAFPAFAAAAKSQTVKVTGGAGSENQSALVLAHLGLHVGDGVARLSNVAITDDHDSTQDGSIGLDALRSASGYNLDFDAMRLDLLTAP